MGKQKIRNKVAERLRWFRAQSGLSRLKAATECDIDPSTLRDYETAKCEPRESIKTKLAKLYGTTVESIFGE